MSPFHVRRCRPPSRPLFDGCRGRKAPSMWRKAFDTQPDIDVPGLLRRKVRPSGLRLGMQAPRGWHGWSILGAFHASSDVRGLAVGGSGAGSGGRRVHDRTHGRQRLGAGGGQGREGQAGGVREEPLRHPRQARGDRERPAVLAAEDLGRLQDQGRGGAEEAHLGVRRRALCDRPDGEAPGDARRADQARIRVQARNAHGEVRRGAREGGNEGLGGPVAQVPVQGRKGHQGVARASALSRHPLWSKA